MEVKEDMPMKTLDGRKNENVHFSWSSENRHVMEVDDSEIFHVIIPDSSMYQITENTTLADMANLDDKRFDGAAGPIRINGAKPGDSIQLEILDIGTVNWGWSAIIQIIGLLKGEFDDTVVIWDVHDKYCTSRGDFLSGIRVPKNPFLGVMGTSPSSGKFGMIPPRQFGGNMDNPLLTRGTKLVLPVHNNGGMISFGDLHAAQGTGEVCGTAIETSGTLTARIHVLEGMKSEYPVARVPGRHMHDSIVTMGIADDLKEASITALRQMISLLHDEKGLTDKESYVLCSVAGNLQISEIVDEPNYVVSLALPENIF